MIYCALFGIGTLILADATTGLLLILAAAACGAFIFWDLQRRGWEEN
jgi:hypothetical protein